MERDAHVSAFADRHNVLYWFFLLGTKELEEPESRPDEALVVDDARRSARGAPPTEERVFDPAVEIVLEGRHTAHR